MEASTDAASLSPYVQVSFVTFCHLIVCPFRVRVLMRGPRSRPCLKTHNAACCPHQQVAVGWWLAVECQRTHRWPAKQIFPFSTRQRDPHPRVSLFAWQTGLWLSCTEVISVWWPIGHAVETHVSLSCISRFCRTLPARCSSTTGSLECEMGKERTEPGRCDERVGGG